MVQLNSLVLSVHAASHTNCRISTTKIWHFSSFYSRPSFWSMVLSLVPPPFLAIPAAPSHPAVVPELDAVVPVHTHLIVCSPVFNACRLPMVWPCATDTKARLFAAKHYHVFLEKFATLQTDKTDRVMYGLCNQLDFIKGSLQHITPGAEAVRAARPTRAVQISTDSFLAVHETAMMPSILLIKLG